MFPTVIHLQISYIYAAEISGTMYGRKTIVVYKYMDDMPVFGEIVEIFVTSISEYLFVLKVLATVRFCARLHSYEVGLTSEINVARQHEFLDHYPLHVIRIDRCFIRLKYICN